MEYTIDGRPKPRATEPIKKQSDIRRIKEYLMATERWRDYCIFVVGCNLALFHLWSRIKMTPLRQSPFQTVPKSGEKRQAKNSIVGENQSSLSILAKNIGVFFPNLAKMENQFAFSPTFTGDVRVRKFTTHGGC